LSKKWVLFSFLFLTLLAVSFYLVIQSGSISKKVKTYAEESLQEFLGQPIKVEEAEVHLFPPSVILKKVSTKRGTIGSPTPTPSEGAAPIPAPIPTMAAEEIGVYFSPWSFFTEAFLIRRIDIQSPTLFLNDHSLGEKPFILNPASKKADGGPPPVIIRTIQVQDAQVIYRGEGTLKELSLKKFNASIQSDLKMSRFEIDLSEGEGEASTEKVQKKIDGVEATLVIYPDKVDLKKFLVASNRTHLRAEGIFRPGEKESLDLRFEARLPIEELDLAAMAGGTILSEKKLAGEMTLGGHLGGSFPKVILAGKLALPHFFVDGGDVGSFASDLSYRENHFALPSFSGELFSGSYTGKAEGPFPFPQLDSDPAKSEPGYKLAIQYKQLSLEKIKKVLSFKQVEARSLEGIFLDGRVSLSGQGTGATGWAADGHLVAKRHSLFSTPLSKESDQLDRLIALVEGGELDWKWSDRRWSFAPGVLQLPDTKATLQGEWDPKTGWRLETDLQSSEMQKVAKVLALPLTGRLRMQGLLSGKELPDSLQGEILLDQWTLLKQPFGTLAAAFRLKGKEILFDQGSMKAPPTVSKTAAAPVKESPGAEPPYRFTGRLSLADLSSPFFDFQADVVSADPQEFITLFMDEPIPLETRATGRLFIKGTPHAFSVHGPLTASKGSLYGERFDRGRVELTVTEKEVRFRKAVLDRQKSHAEGEGEIGYGGTYRLAVKGARLQIDETHLFPSLIPGLSGNMDLEVSGEGTFKKPMLKGTAEVQRLQYRDLEIKGMVKVHWDDQSIMVDGSFPEKKVFLAGEFSLTDRTPFSFRVRFDQLQLDPFFKERLSGPLSNMRLLASGEMKGTGKMSSLNQISLTGSFREVQADFNGYTLQNDGLVILSAKEGVFKFERALFKGDNTSLEFNGGLTVLKEWDLFVNGEADLNLIKVFTKEISSGKGKVLLDLRISDRWEQPQVRGALTLQNGTIRTATLSQTVRLSSVTVLFNERQFILETLEGEMGSGRFHGTGKADLAGFGIGPFSFLLTLEEARVRLLPDLSATLDGELLFQRIGKSQTLQGELTLKKATYDKRTDLRSLVANSGKAREASFESETPVIGRTTMNIHLYGKEEIWINNNIAKIPLDIDLFLKGTFDQPFLIGRINLPEGHVYFRGNDFQIISSSMEFLNQDRIDPIFDIKAKTEVNHSSGITYTVNLNLTGTLSRFTLGLTSFPSLPEGDVLSLLTVRKTSADFAQSQRGVGGNEATTFVVSEILDFEPVQKFTGIDRIQVEPYTNSGTKSSSGSRLTAEKSLMDGRLLMIYSKTLDPSEEDVIRMIYEVNKHVSLVGKRDEKGQIGGDVRFRFEFR
jgi:hypothetical protein